MREFLIRTFSAVFIVAAILGSILLHPGAYAVLLLFVVGFGTFEMARLNGVSHPAHLVVGELICISMFSIAALASLNIIPFKFLWIEFVFPLLPLLMALFSKEYKFSKIAPFTFASLAFLVVPSALMLFMYREDFFSHRAGPSLIILSYALMWVNDTFAYIIGSLCGKHKLFPRISPGKSIEGSIGGLIFTILGLLIYAHITESLSVAEAVGLGLVGVVFGTLGDLCESMLKRQAGVKDSGNLIPGHGGILDRFDSVMFGVPFIFVYLQLL